MRSEGVLGVSMKTDLNAERSFGRPRRIAGLPAVCYGPQPERKEAEERCYNNPSSVVQELRHADYLSIGRYLLFRSQIEVRPEQSTEQPRCSSRMAVKLSLKPLRA